MFLSTKSFFQPTMRKFVVSTETVQTLSAGNAVRLLEQIIANPPRNGENRRVLVQEITANLRI